MTSRSIAALTLAALGLWMQDTGGSQSVEATLQLQTQELLDAIAPGRADVWSKYLHDGMLHVDETGTVRSKPDLLKELQPLPEGLTGRLRMASFTTRVHGDVAIATHEDREDLDYHGQKLASRYRATDTWIRTPAGWRLMASQILAIPEDPPAVSLPPAQLCAYNGAYALTRSITTTIRCQSGTLTSKRTGRPALVYHAETADVFFAPGQPRTRRIFQRDAEGRVTGFVDRREGHDIVWRVTAER